MRKWGQLQVSMEMGTGKRNRIYLDGHEIRDWYSFELHKEIDELNRVLIGFYAEVNLPEEEVPLNNEPALFFPSARRDRKPACDTHKEQEKC